MSASLQPPAGQQVEEAAMQEFSSWADSVLCDSRGTRLRDSQTASTALRASVVFALRVYNGKGLENQLNAHIQAALNACTMGEVRRIIEDVERRLRKTLHPASE